MKSSVKKAVDMKILSLILCLLILAGCSSKEENPVPLTDNSVPAFSDANAKMIILPDETISLEGMVIVKLYLQKTHEWLFPVGYVEATATLEHVEGVNYILTLNEFGRSTPYQTTITPSGIVECVHPVPFDCYDPFDMTWFDNPVDQLEYTTGFALSGPGINKGTLISKGKFDGEKLTALTHFTGIQIGYGSIPVYQQDYEGPLQFELAWDLTVEDD
jgi:hypothetical protein